MASLNHITDAEQRRQIARNLQLHAWYLLVVNSGGIFDPALYTFAVQHGLYKATAKETITAGSVNDLASQGRAVSYQLINNSGGSLEISKMYELAVYLKDFIPFDKLALDYDTYNPNGSMNLSIVIETPIVPPTYVGIRYSNQIETRFNGNVQSGSELLDLYQPPGTQIDTSGFLAGGSGLPADGVVIASNPNPNALPKQNILDAMARAVRSLGPGYAAIITPAGGRAARSSGTKNHPAGDAADHYLTLNGTQILPNQNPALYGRYIRALTSNARSRGVVVGLGGYPWGIHYDESGWRQGSGVGVQTWNNGFDVTAFT